MKKILAVMIGLLLITSGFQARAEKDEAGAVRVYRFDNLDIEGRVKTPHLLNFLKRIRNKFRSFRLPSPNLTEKIKATKEADFL